MGDVSVTEHVLHEFPIHKKGTVAFKLGKIIEILVKLIKLVLLFIYHTILKAVPIRRYTHKLPTRR